MLFQRIYSKLEAELQLKKQNMSLVIEQINQDYNEKDVLQFQIQTLKQNARQHSKQFLTQFSLLEEAMRKFKNQYGKQHQIIRQHSDQIYATNLKMETKPYGTQARTVGKKPLNSTNGSDQTSLKFTSGKTLGVYDTEDLVNLSEPLQKLVEKKYQDCLCNDRIIEGGTTVLIQRYATEPSSTETTTESKTQGKMTAFKKKTSRASGTKSMDCTFTSETTPEQGLTMLVKHTGASNITEVKNMFNANQELKYRQYYYLNDLRAEEELLINEVRNLEEDLLYTKRALPYRNSLDTSQIQSVENNMSHIASEQDKYDKEHMLYAQKLNDIYPEIEALYQLIKPAAEKSNTECNQLALPVYLSTIEDNVMKLLQMYSWLVQAASHITDTIPEAVSEKQSSNALTKSSVVNSTATKSICTTLDSRTESSSSKSFLANDSQVDNSNGFSQSTNDDVNKLEQIAVVNSMNYLNTQNSSIIDVKEPEKDKLCEYKHMMQNLQTKIKTNFMNVIPEISNPYTHLPKELPSTMQANKDIRQDITDNIDTNPISIDKIKHRIQLLKEKDFKKKQKSHKVK